MAQNPIVPWRRSSLLLFLLGCLMCVLQVRQIYLAQKIANPSSRPAIGTTGRTVRTSTSTGSRPTGTSTSTGTGTIKDGRRPTGISISGAAAENVDLDVGLDREKEHPTRKTQPPPLRSDNNSSFSACLLVMDDNHFLIEWLAFHYTTLPLRYLVITVDPRSRTSPKIILDRWEPYMTIVRWNDKRYLPLHWQNRIMREDDPQGLLQKHRERQRHFYPTCFEFLKEAGREWTMVIDIDEFVMAPNPHFVNITNAHRESQDGNDNTTLLQLIRQNTPAYHMPNVSCITMPRLRFGNFENSTSQVKIAPQGFTDQDFLTYRWRYRAGLHDRKTNRNPKSMLQLQRISNFSRQETDAHLPVRSVCPKRNLYILNRASPYTVHHYSGSVEQFAFRRDARAGTANRAKISGYGLIRHAIDTTATGWLPTFIQQVGLQTAKTLLEGVGNVSFTGAVVAQMMRDGIVP